MSRWLYVSLTYAMVAAVAVVATATAGRLGCGHFVGGYGGNATLT